MLQRDSESIDEAGVSLREVFSLEVSLFELGPRAWPAPRSISSLSRAWPAPHSKSSTSMLQNWCPTCFDGDLDVSPILARRDDSPRGSRREVRRIFPVGRPALSVSPSMRRFLVLLGNLMQWTSSRWSRRS